MAVAALVAGSLGCIRGGRGLSQREQATYFRPAGVRASADAPRTGASSVRLGAVHECEDKWIMVPEHTLMVSAFSPRSVRLVRIGLRHRAMGWDAAAGARAWASEYEVVADSMLGASWECEPMEKGLAAARKALAAARRAPLDAPGQAQQERRRYDRVVLREFVAAYGGWKCEQRSAAPARGCDRSGDARRQRWS